MQEKGFQWTKERDEVISEVMAAKDNLLSLTRRDAELRDELITDIICAKDKIISEKDDLLAEKDGEIARLRASLDKSLLRQEVRQSERERLITQLQVKDFVIQNFMVESKDDSSYI